MGIRIYRRYVDDCFLLFKSTDQIPQFLDFLNRQHPNIKFTCEIESNSTLPFLDTSIIRKNGVFETSVYQKPTFTGLFTNFHSFIPSQYKCNLISSLVHRLCNICSNYENFQVHLESLRQILNRNSYPESFTAHSKKRCVNFCPNFNTPFGGFSNTP